MGCRDVERVTFHNAENGFCVLRAKARGHRDLVTVVGHAAIICAGEWITASGEWINDRAHGQQFKARFLKTSAPSSIDGIEKYLGSGMIRGIGPVYAKKMVKAFGEKVFDVIEAEPGRLREVTGIGAVRAKRITDAWAEQKIVLAFRSKGSIGVVVRRRAMSALTQPPLRLLADPGLVLVRGPDRSGFQDERRGWIMSVKLTDAQLVMLSAASQHGELCLTAPVKMKGAILTKVSEKLVKLGLVREIRAKTGMPVWRRDEAGQSYALKLTAAGLKAIAVDDGSEEAIAPKEAPQRQPILTRPMPRVLTSSVNTPRRSRPERAASWRGSSICSSGPMARPSRT